MKKKTLRQEAEGRECQIQTDDCNHDPATTVLCHIHKPSITGGGMGLKGSDILASFGCYACHERVDGRGIIHETTEAAMRDIISHYEGCFKTQKILIDEGKLCLPT